jgi:transposase
MVGCSRQPTISILVIREINSLQIELCKCYDETMNNKDARSLPSVAQEDLRKKAIKAVLMGKKQVDVAESLGVTRQAVGKWVSNYRRGGYTSLKSKQKGRPKGGKLLPRQAAKIAKMVSGHNPRQLKLQGFLWTREAVAELIEQKFGIKVSIWTAGRYMSSWGFKAQKPGLRAYEQNLEAVRNWLDENYLLIQKQAKKEKAAICWGAEMSLPPANAAGKGCIGRGQKPAVSGTVQRFEHSLISATDNRGKQYFMVYKSRVDYAVFLGFLRGMVQQIQHKIYLIVDGNPVYHEARIKNWIQEHEDQIQLVFLPAHSAELNPDKLLNQDIKSFAPVRRMAARQKELAAYTGSYPGSQ